MTVNSMSQGTWTAVDRYFTETFVPTDDALDAALKATRDAGMPAINVTAIQGRLLQILALSVGARAILEIGTLGGYSTIWLARALPAGGRLITLEADPKHAAVARSNLAGADPSSVVEIREGDAVDTLPRLAAEGLGPLDLVFVDADKVNTTTYFEWELRLTRAGSLIVVDNVVRRGAVVDAASTDPNVVVMRRFYERLAAEPRVVATALQTVGDKGYDGIVIAVVK